MILHSSYHQRRKNASLKPLSPQRADGPRRRGETMGVLWGSRATAVRISFAPIRLLRAHGALEETFHSLEFPIVLAIRPLEVM